MQIKTLTLPSKNLAEQAKFYQDLLGFSCKQKGDELRVKTKENTLIFKQSNKLAYYHFCFLIPVGSLEEAIRFLENKGIELLTLKGEKIIHFESGRTIYFYDKDNNIAEFIERPHTGYPEKSSFEIKDVIKVNEIGLPVKNPYEMSHKLIETLHIEPLERIHHDACDHEITIPFPIRRNNMPWRVLGAGFLNKVFVNLLKVIPACAILEVVRVEFPVFSRIIESGLKALFLFLLGDIEENLHDGRALFCQHALEFHNMAVTRLPDFLGVNILHSDCEDVLVVAAVKYNDLAITRHFIVHPPEKIVRQLLFGWFFEWLHVDALGIDFRKNAFDRAVFAASIHRLNNDQNPMLALRIELVLELFQLFSKLV